MDCPKIWDLAGGKIQRTKAHKGHVIWISELGLSSNIVALNHGLCDDSPHAYSQAVPTSERHVSASLFAWKMTVEHSVVILEDLAGNGSRPSESLPTLRRSPRQTEAQHATLGVHRQEVINMSKPLDYGAVPVLPLPAHRHRRQPHCTSVRQRCPEARFQHIRKRESQIRLLSEDGPDERVVVDLAVPTSLSVVLPCPEPTSLSTEKHDPTHWTGKPLSSSSTSSSLIFSPS